MVLNISPDLVHQKPKVIQNRAQMYGFSSYFAALVSVQQWNETFFRNVGK